MMCNIAGITLHPQQAFMMQAARKSVDVDAGFLCGKRYLILGRDTKFSAEFRSLLHREGTSSDFRRARQL